MTVVFHVVYLTVFNTFVASIRQSALSRLVNRNVRPIEAFSENTAGPVIESRPALPHWPGAGAVNAAGLRNSPAGAAVIEAPV